MIQYNAHYFRRGFVNDYIMKDTIQLSRKIRSHEKT